MVNKNRNTGIICMITSCFFFSVLGGLIKFLGEDVHAFVQAFYRNLFSIILLLPFLFSNGTFTMKTTRIGLLFLRSFFGSLTMILIFFAYTLSPLSQVVVISFSTPLFIFLGGILFFKEKTTSRELFLLILGFIFILLAMRPNLQVGLGTWLALGASVFHAIAGLLVKELSKTEKILNLMFFMVFFMTIITFFPASLMIKEEISSPLWIGLFLLAVCGTLGNFFWTYAIAKTDITNIIPFDFSKLIFTCLIGFFVFSEKIDLLTIIGGLGIICCNIFIYRLKSN